MIWLACIMQVLSCHKMLILQLKHEIWWYEKKNQNIVTYLWYHAYNFICSYGIPFFVYIYICSRKHSANLPVVSCTVGISAESYYQCLMYYSTIFYLCIISRVSYFFLVTDLVVVMWFIWSFMSFWPVKDVILCHSL